MELTASPEDGASDSDEVFGEFFVGQQDGHSAAGRDHGHLVRRTAIETRHRPAHHVAT